MQPTDARTLLDDTQRLRRRARADRQATSLPLLILGAVTLLGAGLVLPTGDTDTADPLWVIGAGLGFLALAWWSARQQTRTGIGSGRGSWLAVGLALLLPTLTSLAWRPIPIRLSPSLPLPAGVLVGYLLLLTAGLPLLAAVGWWRHRGAPVGQDRDYWRTAGAMLLGLLVQSLLLATLTPLFGPLPVVAFGVLLVAAWQRNPVLAAWAVAFGTLTTLEHFLILSNRLMDLTSALGLFHAKSGYSPQAPALAYALIGLLLLAGGLLARRTERAA